jgi:ADP-heptose:LPS heptosyltransferase
MSKVLFVELLGGIGDVLIALGAIQALSRSYSTSEVTVLTFLPGGELLETDPSIHRIIYAEAGKAKQLVIELLSGETFDLIVSDTNYEEIDKVIENSGALRVVTNLWQQPPPDQRVGDRFLEILLAEGLINPDAIKPAQLHLTRPELDKAQKQFHHLRRPLIFFYPDAGMAIKRWSELNFITLGKVLQRFWGATVIVPVGSNINQSIYIVEEIGGQAQILPRGKLRDLAAALACADLVVAADTGPARIAAALNVPTITLFGPSWHGRYGQPLPHINLQGYPECPERNISNFTIQHCWYSGICSLEKGWQSCMEDISVDGVLAVVEKFLREWKQGNRGTRAKNQ